MPQPWFASSGELVCPSCKAFAEIDRGEARAARSIFGASGGAIVLALLATFVANPCWLTSFFGVLSAISTFVLIFRNPEIAARMGWRKPAAMLLALFGAGLCFIAPFVSAPFFALAAGR